MLLLDYTSDKTVDNILNSCSGIIQVLYNCCEIRVFDNLFLLLLIILNYFVIWSKVVDDCWLDVSLLNLYLLFLTCLLCVLDLWFRLLAIVVKFLVTLNIWILLLVLLLILLASLNALFLLLITAFVLVVVTTTTFLVIAKVVAVRTHLCLTLVLVLLDNWLSDLFFSLNFFIFVLWF